MYVYIYIYIYICIRLCIKTVSTHYFMQTLGSGSQKDRKSHLELAVFNHEVFKKLQSDKFTLGKSIFTGINFRVLWLNLQKNSKLADWQK